MLLATACRLTSSASLCCIWCPVCCAWPPLPPLLGSCSVAAAAAAADTATTTAMLGRRRGGDGEGEEGMEDWDQETLEKAIAGEHATLVPSGF